MSRTSRPVADPCRRCGQKGLVWYQTKSGQWVPAHPDENGMADPTQIHWYRCKKKAGSLGTRSFKASEYRVKRRRR